MNPWLLLALAIGAEVFGTTSLKLSDGLTRPPWVVAVVCAYGFAFYAFSVAVRVLPLGLAYAVWAGAGTIGACLIGLWVFHEPMALSRWLGVGLVVAGIALLHFTPSAP